LAEAAASIASRARLIEIIHFSSHGFVLPFCHLPKMGAAWSGARSAPMPRPIIVELRWNP